MSPPRISPFRQLLLMLRMGFGHRLNALMSFRLKSKKAKGGRNATPRKRSTWITRIFSVFLIVSIGLAFGSFGIQ